MHPFGGTQICPRCSKAVYAAEQVMGPGRKLYHKPCLACTTCNKRLDSYTLLEHDQQPYWYFLFLADSISTEPASTANPATYGTSARETYVMPTSHTANPPRLATLGISSSDAPQPLLRPNRTLATSPVSASFPRAAEALVADPEQPLSDVDIESQEKRDQFDARPSTPIVSPVRSGTPSNSGRFGGLPRTVPLTPTRSRPGHFPSNSVGSTPAQFTGGTPAHSTGAIQFTGGSPAPVSPIKQTATGTRYGVALGGTMPVQFTGGMGGSPRKWGAASTPTCPRCGKSVYFAEQVKAVGKTFHKHCLRCAECSTLLDSSRLRDHDGEPLCMRCYGKLHGPQGGGYALLGKAGG
ncbi:hypothetical protein DXG03_004200 [Asterophora parasitica]|uniref:LIM zinc-binding domain-containing protein n=1 Tax=Asterophora parasitica TaxID=117018 RepID=A0A9P7GFE1_9AGAR|nr:hypothetical protein DXG03_004200 [Asterophora parasitica]